MKVAVAVDENSLGSKIAKRFGHARYYLIVDPNDMSFDTINNPADEDHSIIYEIANLGVDTFIVGNIGPHAFEIAKSLNMRIMCSRKTTAEEAISKLRNDQLELLEFPTLKKSIHEHRK